MDSPEELTDLTPVSPRSNRRPVLVGAVVGMMALGGTIIGLRPVADAADNGDPLITLAAETGDGDAGDGETLIANFDPDFDEEAWQAHEQCMADQLGDLWIEPDVLFSGDELDDPWVDGEEPSEAEWDAYDIAWQAADEACLGHLPEHVQAQMGVFDACDQCLKDAGVFDEGLDIGTKVHVETPDGFQVVEFGPTEGSVTISGTADSVTVTSKGGVTVLDEAALEAQWSEIDAAYEACEQLLAYGLSGTEEA